jgi:hypothetical protein
MEHDLYKNMGDIDVCIEFDMFEVKVPIIFSVQWVSRYVGRDVTVLEVFLNFQSRGRKSCRLLRLNNPQVEIHLEPTNQGTQLS